MEKKTRNYRIVIITVLFLTVGVALNSDLFFRNLWSNVVGDTMDIDGAAISTSGEFFFFPRVDEELLMIGYGDGNDVKRSDKNVIYVATYSRTNSIVSRSEKFCEVKNRCKDLESFMINGANRCISFQAVGIAKEKQLYHYFCDLENSDIVVEYHGEDDMDKHFRKEFGRLIEVIEKEAL